MSAGGTDAASTVNATWRSVAREAATASCRTANPSQPCGATSEASTPGPNSSARSTPTGILADPGLPTRTSMPSSATRRMTARTDSSSAEIRFLAQSASARITSRRDSSRPVGSSPSGSRALRQTPMAGSRQRSTMASISSRRRCAVSGSTESAGGIGTTETASSVPGVPRSSSMGTHYHREIAGIPPSPTRLTNHLPSDPGHFGRVDRSRSGSAIPSGRDRPTSPLPNRRRRARFGDRRSAGHRRARPDRSPAVRDGDLRACAWDARASTDST